MKKNITLNDVLKLINSEISGDDMMEYIEDELMILILNITKMLNLNVFINVTNISDGKYKIDIENNGERKSIETTACEPKEQFAKDLLYLLK